MTSKHFNGKAIYNPSGKAGEYSYWACNLYVGCSNGCTYCYCKKGLLAKAMGGSKPTLKKCFRDEDHALEVFVKELKQNLSELQKHGLFFSFTTDPLINETWELTYCAINMCIDYKVPVKVLTKSTKYIDKFIKPYWFRYADKIAFGFTLTGHDELEPNASPNQERIAAMTQLHQAGFKTFASIEPIIDFESSLAMIKSTVDFCDLYKIGFMSGKKYDRDETIRFQANVHQSGCKKIYWKDSIKDFVRRANAYPITCVGRDYNLFN